MATITVENGQSIQEAIDKANGGDEIIVKKGSYNERLVINNQVTIRGESAERDKMPVIWSSFDDYDDEPCCVISVEESCTLENLVVRENESGEVPSAEGAGDYAEEEEPGPAVIFVHQHGAATIRNVLAADSAMAGILVWHGSAKIIKCEVTGNLGIVAKDRADLLVDMSLIHDCNDHGITILGGVGGQIAESYIYRNKCGIWLDGEGTSPYVERSVIFDNEGHGVHIQYCALGSFEECVIYGNKGSNIYCVNDADDFDYDDEEEYPSFVDCYVFNSEKYGVETYDVPINFESDVFLNKGGDSNDDYIEGMDLEPLEESDGTGLSYEQQLAVKKISLSPSVKYINDDFNHCVSLESVEIPSGVESIGEDAFKCCVSLESVTIPDSVKEIEMNAFAFCPRLKSVSVPSDAEIADGAFDRWCKVERRSASAPTSTNPLADMNAQLETSLSDDNANAVSSSEDKLLEPISTRIAKTYKIEIPADEAKNGCKKIVRYNRKIKDGIDETVRVLVEVPAGTEKEIVFVSDEGDYNQATGKNNAAVIVVRVL